jgi:hypothetical protein
MEIILIKSPNMSKKWRIVFGDKSHLDFGGAGYGDYTTHGDYRRKLRYIKRHEPNENWDKSGIKTAGFWARWLLWNRPNLNDSVKDIENRFGVNIDIYN